MIYVLIRWIDDFKKHQSNIINFLEVELEIPINNIKWYSSRDIIKFRVVKQESITKFETYIKNLKTNAEWEVRSDTDQYIANCYSGKDPLKYYLFKLYDPSNIWNL
jgi:hypothetical protein